MKYFLVLTLISILCENVFTKITNSALLNRINDDILKTDGKDAKFFSPTKNDDDIVKPVGNDATFISLTTPALPSGRRHLEDICDKNVKSTVVRDQPNVAIVGDYYDELQEKIMATIKIPHHIDRHHFEVTSPEPYYTVGDIQAIGFHPTTHKIDECEKIYQDHIGNNYSEESADVSEESLEMIRVPVNNLNPKTIFVEKDEYDEQYE